MGTFIPISRGLSSQVIMRTVAVFLTFTLVVNVCQAGLWAGIMDMVKRDATEEADVEVDHSLHDHHLEEQAKMGVDNSLDDLTELSKEGAVDNSLNDLTEQSKEGAGDNSLEDDNTLFEASKQVEVEDALSEESLEGDGTLSEESKLSETANTLSEDSLEVVNILPEAAKLVADDKSLSDLVEAEKSALDSDDVSDEARWFLHGTCSCDEHQSPGQQVATCQVDILRPEPEKYSYLGYNNCDQGYVPVCGRIFTVCYCLCKWDYNAATTTAAPATTSAPATTATPHGHDHE